MEGDAGACKIINEVDERRKTMIEFLAGLAIGLAGWIISSLCAAGGKADLEKENARLRKELRILKGG